MKRGSTHSQFKVSVGSVLGRSARAWMRNCIPFTALIFVLHLPLIAWAVVVGIETFQGSEPNFTHSLIFESVASFFPWILILWASAALFERVFGRLEGEKLSMGHCVGVGLRRLIPALGVAVEVFVATAVPFFLGSIFHPLVGAILSALIVCLLFVAVPAAVVERTGFLGSLQRSVSLTRGKRGMIFLLIMTIGALLLALGLLADFADGHVDDTENMIVWIGAAAVFAVFGLGGFIVTTIAVVYHDLRQLNEGVGVDKLKDVFS